ncbi:MAG: hypothetical protein VB012_01675 [Erysipelotrichaceae bacterium]|nr:hypothetical protein [Erysipelotrichaceae bacterium]
MRQLLIKTLVTILLVITLILLVMFNISYFIGGPMLLNRLADQQIMQNMERKEKKTSCALVSRFADDEVYYVALCDNYYIFYNNDPTVLAERHQDTLNVAKVIDLYANIYDLADATPSLGYYHKKPVYVLDSDQFELLIDYDSYEVLRYYQKG